MRRILLLSGLSAAAMAVAWAIGFGAAVVTSPPIVAPPEDVVPPSNFALYSEVWRHVDTEYYGDRPNANEISRGAVEGVVEAIDDPWSVVVSGQDAPALGPRVAGAIGAWIEPISDGVRVLSVLPDSPAELQGLQPGDLIVNAEVIEADDDGEQDFLAVDTLEPLALAELLGTVPTDVSVIVVREGEAAFTLEFAPQDAIASEPVAHRELQDGVAYLRLGELSARTAEGIDAALEALDGTSSLVLDLRDNPGGDLASLIAVSEWFLDGDLYVTDEDGVETTTDVDGDGAARAPEVVLVNRGTGGTAEILAAALADRGARLVGETTFGRDGLQEDVSLSDGTVVRMTTKRWRTPGGRSVEEAGLTPDTEVSGRDAQLAQAVELVLAAGAADSSGAATSGG